MAKHWISLKPQMKKHRLLKAYQLLRKQADKQLQEIKAIEGNGSVKDIRHLFLFTTIRDAWDNLDFLFQFGRKSKWQGKAHYPIRSVLDTTARIAYFTRQNEVRQKELSRSEGFKTLKALYDFSLRTEDKQFLEKIIETYNSLKEHGDPKIEDPKKKFKKTQFPDIVTCLQGGKVANANALYGYYEEASQLSHGNFYTSIMKKEDKNLFLRIAQLGLELGNEILRATDFHIKGEVTKDVDKIKPTYLEILTEG